MSKDADAGKATVNKKGIRSHVELEILKIILDENPDLKKKVLRFMKKNHPGIFIEKHNERK